MINSDLNFVSAEDSCIGNGGNIQVIPANQAFPHYHRKENSWEPLGLAFFEATPEKNTQTSPTPSANLTQATDTFTSNNATSAEYTLSMPFTHTPAQPHSLQFTASRNKGLYYHIYLNTTPITTIDAYTGQTTLPEARIIPLSQTENHIEITGQTLQGPLVIKVSTSPSTATTSLTVGTAVTVKNLSTKQTRLQRVPHKHTAQTLASMEGGALTDFLDENGTFIVDFTPTTHSATILGNNGLLDLRINSSYQVEFLINSATVVTSTALVVPNMNNRISVGFDTNTVNLSVNGTTSVAGSQAGIPTLDELFIGSNGTSEFLNGFIKQLLFYRDDKATSFLESTATVTRPQLTIIDITHNPVLLLERNSTKSYINSSNIIAYAPADTLAEDYLEGFSINQGSTNLAGALNTWTLSNASSISEGTAPDGGTAIKLIENTANSSHGILKTGVSFTSGTTYTYSCYFKASERSFAGINAYDGTNSYYAAFDLLTGTMSDTVYNGVIPRMVAIGSWWKCSITFNPLTTAAGNIMNFIQPSLGSTSYVGSGSSGIYAFGSKLETGSIATPYGDFLTDKTSILDRDWYNPAEGTFVFSLKSTLNSHSIITDLYKDLGIIKTGSLEYNVGSRERNKIALAYNATSRALSVNGSTEAVLNTPISGLASSILSDYSGNVELIDYYPTRRTDLDTLTAHSELVLFDSTTSYAFRRDSVGTYYNSSGLLSTAARNVLRTTYNPTTLVSEGELLEPAVTNALLYSEDLFSWGKTALTVTSNGATDPYGSALADILIEDGTNSAHYASQSASFVSGTEYTFSVFAKTYGNGGKRYLSLAFPTAAFTSQIRASIDLADGTIVENGVIGVGVSLPGGWWRFSITATATATASSVVYIVLSDTGASGGSMGARVGDSVSGLTLFGTQLEPGSCASSYTTATRAADIEGLSTSFTRASTATYVGHDGKVKKAGVDAPRFDYDPVTLTAKGLLVESAATNLLLKSSDWSSSSYSKVNLTGTYNVITSPAGDRTADLMSNPGGGGVNHHSASNIPLTAGTAVTFSQFFKAGPTGGNACMRIQGTYPARADVCFNLATESFDFTGATTFTGLTYGFQKFSNGWYRVWLSAIPDATLTGSIAFGPSTLASNGWEGPTSGAADVYCWGRDAISGISYPRSHIPTESATVTCATDSALITTTKFSDWFNPVEGTILVEFDANLPAGGSTEYNILELGTGASSNRHRLYIYGNNVGGGTTSGGVVQADIQLSGYTPSTTYKAAYAYGLNNCGLAVNGIVGTDNVATMPTGLISAAIGGSTVAGVAGISGHIHRVVYYPERLPDATIQSLTT